MTMRNKLALLLVLPALASCGMLPGQARQGTGGEEKQASAQQSTPTRATEAPSEEPTEASTQAPTGELTAITSRKIKHDDNDLRIDITQLKRTGKVVTLTWTVTNVGTKGSWYVGANLGSDVLDFTTSAVSLIDPVNGKRHRVARNGAGQDAACVCSRVNQHIEAGGALEMYAVYGAPPADVTKVNVEMADLGVFNDVPVS
ncbi:hypothetical protein ACIBEJ_15250 [Nonomuraea sp. NPDC050790]|uniref:hypothetical protein n=1 Tax=Nonomuraea sp. NPDC050790 TaxID=3364371 RepID=UPI0037BD00B6